jgi:hypothetical protein
MVESLFDFNKLLADQLCRVHSSPPTCSWRVCACAAACVEQIERQQLQKANKQQQR